MKPRIIHINKARPVGKDRPVPSLIIRIEKAFPEFDNLLTARLAHARDASILHNWLYHALPGGTYDALFGMMAEQKASVFRVSHNAYTKKKNKTKRKQT